MNIRLIQMDISNDVHLNLDHAERLIREGNTDVVDIVLLPEMFTTGYQLPIISQLAHEKSDPLFSRFRELAKHLNLNIVFGSVAYKEESNVYNTTFVINRNGEIISSYHKVHLFKLMNEHDYLTQGEFYHDFILDDSIMSSIICYDLRFPELMRQIVIEKRPKIIFVPMEWPAPRTSVFQTLLRARAIENQCFIVSCNRVGMENGSTFEGSSMVIDPYGNIVFQADDSDAYFDVSIDLNLVDKVRGHITSLDDRRPELYKL